MHLSIDKIEPWIKANLKQAGEPTHGVKSELDYLASGEKKAGDEYITKPELLKRKYSTKGRPITTHLVSAYFKSKIIQKSITLSTANGTVLEEVLIYDDNDERIDRMIQNPSPAGQVQKDMILRKVPDSLGDYDDITLEVKAKADAVLKFFYKYNLAADRFELRSKPLDLTDIFEKIKENRFPQHHPQEQDAWEKLNITQGLNLHFLVSLYRLHQMAVYSRQDLESEIDYRAAVQFDDLRNIIDSATPAVRRKKGKQYLKDKFDHKIRNQFYYELENKFITDTLSSLFNQSEANDEPQLPSEDLAMAVIEMNHLIDMTDGEYGLRVLRKISHTDWTRILGDFDLTQSIFTTLTQAVHVQSLRFYRRFYNEDTNINRKLTRTILERENPDKPWLNIISACSLSLGMKKQMDNLDVELILKNIDLAHDKIDDKSYPYSSIIYVILNTFGELSQKQHMNATFREGAVRWCKKFLSEFESFDDSNDGRKMLLKTQRVLISLDGQAAQEFLFEQLFDPLETNFNPREDKQLAHNAYYAKVGGAEKLARVSGQKRLAFRRQLDQSTNEWGRDLEKRIREDAIFRLDVLQEAKTALQSAGETSVQKIVSEYDPDGILQRNLAFIHVMRYIYSNRISFDPLDINTYLEVKINPAFFSKASTRVS